MAGFYVEEWCMMVMMPALLCFRRRMEAVLVFVASVDDGVTWAYYAVAFRVVSVAFRVVSVVRDDPQRKRQRQRDLVSLGRNVNEVSWL